MGKKKKKIETYDAADIISTVTKSLTKKGKIKGDSDKQTKILKLACPHHKFVVKKDGKKYHKELEATLRNEGNYLVCKMCKAKIRANMMDDQELEKSIGKTMDVIQQMKFLIPATTEGETKDAIRYVTRMAVDVGQIPKVYKNLRKVVKKSEQVRKRKNRHREDGAFGDWSTNGKI